MTLNRMNTEPNAAADRTSTANRTRKSLQLNKVQDDCEVVKLSISKLKVVGRANVYSSAGVSPRAPNSKICEIKKRLQKQLTTPPNYTVSHGLADDIGKNGESSRHDVPMIAIREQPCEFRWDKQPE